LALTAAGLLAKNARARREKATADGLRQLGRLAQALLGQERGASVESLP
jgi:hypothetical protein